MDKKNPSKWEEMYQNIYSKIENADVPCLWSALNFVVLYTYENLSIGAVSDILSHLPVHTVTMPVTCMQKVTYVAILSASLSKVKFKNSTVCCKPQQ